VSAHWKMINDDSTVSSSEEGGVPSNDVRYSITALFSRSDQGDEIQTQTFDVEAIKSESESSTFDSLFSGDSYLTIKVDPFTVTRADYSNSITAFEQSPKGCVCLATFDSVKEIDMVLRTAYANEASALLTVKEPTDLTLAELPVFVVSTEMMYKLTHTHVEQVSVMFQRFPEAPHPITNIGTSSSPSNENVQNHGIESASSGQTDTTEDVGEPVTEQGLSSKSESEACMLSSTVVCSSKKTEQGVTMPDAPGKFSEAGSVVSDESHPIIDLSEFGMHDFANDIPTASDVEQTVSCGRRQQCELFISEPLLN